MFNPIVLGFIFTSFTFSFCSTFKLFITKYFTSSRFLNVEACHGAVTDVGIKSLSNLEHLEELNISYLTEVFIYYYIICHVNDHLGVVPASFLCRLLHVRDIIYSHVTCFSLLQTFQSTEEPSQNLCVR